MARNTQTMYGKPLNPHFDKHVASEATGKKLEVVSSHRRIKSIAYLHTRLTVLCQKCNYNQCYMNT